MLYSGNSSGGRYGSKKGLIKFGTRNPAYLEIQFKENILIKNIVLFVEKWTDSSSDKVEVDGVSYPLVSLGNNYGEMIVIELENSSNKVRIDFKNRGFLFKLGFYGPEGTLPEPPKFYDVEFNLNYQSAPLIENQIILEGNTVIEPVEEPTRTGYNFVGWFIDEELNNAYDFDEPVISDLTLYAKWDEVIVYTVKFIDIDNQEIYPNQVINKGGKAIQPADPRVDGYDFLGWFLDLSSEEEFDFDTEIESNLSIYAKLIKLSDDTFIYILDADKAGVSTSYQSLDIEDGNMFWKGSASKSSKKGYLGTRVADNVEIEVKEGYYIYSIEIKVHSESDTSSRTISIDGETIVSGVKESNPVVGIKVFEEIRTELKLIPDGALQYEYIKVVIKELDLTDEEYVLLAKEDLDIGYTIGDSIDEVTDDLSLPTEGMYNTVITWSSSNENIISNSGVVIRPQETIQITLTATIELNSASITKEFVLTVIDEGVELPSVLLQADFLNTRGWNQYTLQEDREVINGELDPSDGVSTKWDILGAHVNNNGWDYIRVGGKNASSESSPQVYLKPNVVFDKNVGSIEIVIIGLDSAYGNEKIHVQTFVDGEWITEETVEITKTGILEIDGLDINSGLSIRLLFERETTSNNVGTDITEITFYSK